MHNITELLFLPFWPSPLSPPPWASCSAHKPIGSIGIQKYLWLTKQRKFFSSICVHSTLVIILVQTSVCDSLKWSSVMSSWSRFQPINLFHFNPHHILWPEWLLWLGRTRDTNVISWWVNLAPQITKILKQRGLYPTSFLRHLWCLFCPCFSMFALWKN